MKKLFLFLFIAILLVTPVISAEWFTIDNWKDYNSETKEVIIKDLTGEIGGAKLLTPLNVRVGQGYQKVAEFELWAYEDYNDVIKSFTFKDMKENKEISRNIDVKKKVIEQREVFDYGQEFIGYYPNGTEEYKRVVIGSRNEEKVIWTKLTPADLKKDDKVTIALFTDVEKGDYIDWIPEIYGVEVTEWATWTADLNVNISFAYKMEETSGDVVDSAGNYNATNNGATRGVSGKIANGFSLDGTNDYVNNTLDLSAQGTDWSFSLWAKPYGLSGGNTYDHTIFSDDVVASFSTYLRCGNSLCEFLVHDGTNPAGIVQATGLSDNNWYHFAGTYDWSTGTVELFLNGSSVGTDTTGGAGGMRSSDTFRLGKANAGRYFNGTLDEVTVWARKLTNPEIVQLYNSGTGITYTEDFGINVTLVSPTDSYLTSSQNVNFTCNATSQNNISNVTLVLDGVNNETNSSLTGTDIEVTFNKNLAEGEHNWTCLFYDDIGVNGTATVRTLEIDTTAPIINITNPTSLINYGYDGYTLNLNWTLTESNPDTCLYDYSGTNVSVTCTDLNTTFNITNYENRNITFCVNDTVGFLTCDSQTWNYKVYEESVTYTAGIPANLSNSYIINVLSDGSETLSAVFTYNGVEYTATKSGSDTDATFTSTITPSSTGTFNFNWTITHGSTNITTQTYSQVVSDLGLIECGAGDTLFNITIFDEGTKTLIPLTDNITFAIDINIKTSSGVLVEELSAQIDNKSNIKICINSSVLGSNQLVLDAIMQYDTDTRVPEFYNIQTYNLTNSSLNYNISLYDLLTTDAQEFKITYKDSNFLPVEDALIIIQRQYIADGEFITIEIPKTDSNGETIGHLVLSDVIYNMIVVKNGVTLASFNNIIAVCNNVATGDCEINLNAFSSHIETEEYTSFNNIAFSPSYDKDTRTFTITYHTTDGSSINGILNATRLNNYANVTICSDSSSSTSDTLTCVIPVNNQNQTIMTNFYADGELISLSVLNLNVDPDVVYGGSKTALSLILLLTTIGMGISSSAVVLGIFIIVGVLLVSAINLIGNAGYIGAGASFLWLVITIVVVLWKLNRRNN